MPLGLEAYPYLTLLVPVLVFLGSWIVSRLLGFAWWLCALLACFPLVIPDLNLPISESAKSVHPLFLIGCGWAVLFVIGLARALVRPARAAIGSPGGVVSAVYLMALLGALTVVTILYVEPSILERTVPGWRGGLGLVLLSVAALTMAISLMRVMRLVLVFAVWGFVSVVLASEIFLHKLPTDVFREEVVRVSPLLSRDRFEGFLSSLAIAFQPQASPKVAIMRTSPVVGGVKKEETYPERLGYWLRRVSPWATADVISADGDDLSVVQLSELLRSKVLPQRPDVVVISSLLADARISRNAFGEVGVSEGTADRLRRQAQATEASFFSRFWNDSRVMRVIRYAASDDEIMAKPKLREPRVLPGDYRQTLKSMIARVRANDAQPLLLVEPIEKCPSNTECATYAKVIRSLAEETGTALIDGSEAVRGVEVGYPFIRANVLSAEGHDQLAKALTTKITSLLGKRSGGYVEPVRFDDPRDSALAGMPVNILVNPRDLSGDVVFQVQQLQPGPLYYRIVFSVNDSFVADRRQDTRDPVRARFQIPDGVRGLPVAKLSLQVVASPPGRDDLIGETGVQLPVPLTIAADGAEGAVIESSTGGVQSSWGNELIGAGIDPRSGMFISDTRVSATSDGLLSLQRWADGLPWGTVVALAGTFGNEVTPRPVKFAAVDLTPRKGESFTALGVVGMRGSSGMVKRGVAAQRIERGSKIVREMSKFKLDSVQHNGSDLLQLQHSWRIGA